LAASLPLETQTLYAELLEHMMAVRAQHSIGHLTGSFAEKTIKGERYLYWQASQPGGRTKQFYLGRRTRALELLVKRLQTARTEIAPDLARIRTLAAQLRTGGANVTDAASGRVVRALADSGLFDAGAVLAGTHAFAVLGNVLGVRWGSASLRTQDVDLASATEGDVDVAVPDVKTDVPSVLESLDMGFLPVPPLDPRHPSTSFKVRGRSLRVDLLCPKRGSTDRAVFLERFNAAAQPLAYMDYLLEAPERAVLLDGGASLVNVPAPARFALHKLMVAPLRPAAFQTKAEKDVMQASEVLATLIADRPGDVTLAWDVLQSRGKAWGMAMARGLTALRRRSPEVHAELTGLLGRRRAGGRKKVTRR
jgi:hypothetical protein